MATRTPYTLTLHHVESCNCHHGCNCQFEGYPNEGKCEFLIGWQVIAGRFGSTVLDGTRFVIAAMYPKAIHEGNGRVALFVDADTPSDRVQALGTILTGQAGGMPWEALAGTVSSLKGPVLKRISMKIDGPRSTFSVPGILEVAQRPIRDALSGQDKDVHITYPKGGFMWNDGSICSTSIMRLDFEDMVFDHQGRYAAYAQTRWSNQ